MGSLLICSWRFVFYLCSFFGGLSVLYHVSVPDCFLVPPPVPQAPTEHQAWLWMGVWRGAGGGESMCTEKTENVARSWQMFPSELGAGDPAVSQPMISSESGNVARQQIAELSKAAPRGLEKPKESPVGVLAPQMPVSLQESWLWRPAMCWDNYPNQVSGGGGRGWREDWGSQSSCGHR